MSNVNQFEGTRDIPAERQIDATALSDWLSTRVARFEGPMTMSLFKGGQSNPTYLITTPTARYVLRTKPGPVASLLPSAHGIEREYAVLTALHGSKVPVPRTFALCEDETVIGRAFYLMEFLEGNIYWDQSLPTHKKQDRKEIYAEMNRVIASLHSADFRSLGLAGFERPGNYLQRQISRWSKQYAASASEPIEEMELLMDWLPRNLPSSAADPKLACVVHGDYRLDNIVFTPGSSRVAGVLDWELWTIGHAFADFSYHLLSWFTPPEEGGKGLAGLDLKALGIPGLDAYLELYCQHTGFATPTELKADLPFYIAYNFFRVAAILQGVAKRVEVGTAGSNYAQQSSVRARKHAVLAWQYARQV